MTSRLGRQLRAVPDTIWMTAIMGLGFALRFADLGGQSLWYDEAFSWWVASQPSDIGLWLLLHDAVHPPLHYLLLHLVTAFDQSEFALRFLSAVFSLVSIPVIYQLGRALSGHHSRARQVGLLAAAFLAVNPFHVWYAREARNYELTCLLSLLIFYAFHQLLRGRDYWLHLVVSSVLAYFTHYFAVLLAIPQLIFMLLNLRTHRRLISRWLLAQGLAAIPLILWLIRLFSHGVRLGGLEWIPEPGLFAPVLTLRRFALFDAEAPVRWAALGLPFFALTLGLGLRTRQRRVLVVSWLFAPPVLVLLLSRLPLGFPNLYIDRYLIISLPAFALLLARGLGQLRREWVRLTMASVLILLSATATLRIFTDPRLFKEDSRSAMSVVAQNRRAGDLLILEDLMLLLPAIYYLPNLEPWTVLPREADVDEWGAVLDGFAPRRVWLVDTNAAICNSAVTPGGDIDIHELADPATAAWLDGRQSRALSYHSYLDICVLLIDTPP